ncbi:MAG: hypothetical protein JXO51_06440 [Candidatus Aminicenantes bacterium]|nr:hypothetical protein [Candidatus Aminicenantes bacterium]
MRVVNVIETVRHVIPAALFSTGGGHSRPGRAPFPRQRQAARLLRMDGNGGPGIVPPAID